MNLDWKKISLTVLISRELDRLEEVELFPQRKVPYQFSARGHDVAQVILGSFLNRPRDAVGAYYRSRPLVMTLGLSAEDALASSLARSGGFSDGRDIGVVCNLPGKDGPTVLPMAGDVGSQFTPAIGWAQAIVYRSRTLKEKKYSGCIAVAHSGEAGVATNGFWSALTIATTCKLPVLFAVEDNGFGISVSSDHQTPGGNIAANLKSFSGLRVFDGDGTNPEEVVATYRQAIDYIRSEQSPVLARLSVPRLSGHSGQDTQAYKPPELIEAEQARDPLPKLKNFVTSSYMTAQDWSKLEEQAAVVVSRAFEAAQSRAEPKPESIYSFVFSRSSGQTGTTIQTCGGLHAEGHKFPQCSAVPQPEETRINFITAIRRTLESEMRTNPKVLVFGEDVGKKGGVHAATVGLQEEFGVDRVFDTSLSEEGIIGRSVGMALAGLMPVPEIQFRKYADPATEQLNNCGTIRWRTANKFAAPIVVRIPGGFFRCGDPWHSVCGEVNFAHAVGWQVAIPSNAEDASGLLRTALRGNDPVIFFEHRYLLDAPSARRPYPGDNYCLPFGLANIVREGKALTVVSWGAMLEFCEQAAKDSAVDAEIIDLRTIAPWDRDTVLNSVKKTRRCVIVHEDGMTAGFGAEICAVLASEAFFSLDAPIKRVAVRDVPIPYNVRLMQEVVPQPQIIAQAFKETAEF